MSSSEFEPEPTDELSWLSIGGTDRKPSPESERVGVSVRERMRSRLLGLISFFIFRVIQLPRLERGMERGMERGGRGKQNREREMGFPKARMDPVEDI